MLWALKVFEALSEIRINFTKTKLISLNISQEEVLDSFVDCKLSTFPLKYLVSHYQIQN
jgi:hypothetical protein